MANGWMAGAFALFSLGFPAGNLRADEKAEKKPGKVPTSVLEFQVKDIDGKQVDMKKFRNKVLLIVNVASR